MQQPPPPPSHLRPRLLATAVLLLLVVGGYHLRDGLQLQWSRDALRALVEQLGVWAPVAFVGLIAFRVVLLVPSQLTLVVGGACFGVVQGALLGTAGLTLSAALTFTLTRMLDGELVRRHLPARMRASFEAAGRPIGALVVMVGSALPIGPMSAFHAGAGLTAMRFGPFLLAAVVGGAVRALLFTWLGDRLVQGGLSAAWPALLALSLLLLPWAHPRLRSRLLGPGVRG